MGSAIEEGIKRSNFNYVAVFMADSSDSINDLNRYYKIISTKKYDAILGSDLLRTLKLKIILFSNIFSTEFLIILSN